MFSRIISVVYLVVAGGCFAQEYLHMSTPLSFQWPSNSEEAAELKLNNADVLKVLNDIYGDNAAPAYAVDTFTFAQLEPGKLYLIAAVDGSGRALFYGTGIAYCKSPDTCTEQGIYDAPPHNYSEELVDLDGNGVKEIVAKDLAGGYEGYASMPVFTYKIYKVIDGRATDVSLQYKAYYESALLPKMKADVARARAMFPDQKDQDIIDALAVLAQDDYARRILKQPTAGIEHAKVWVHSGNRRLEDYALQTLSRIDSPESDAVLQDLTKSDKQSLAEAAAREIEIRESWRKNEQLKRSLPPQKQQ